MKPVFCFLQYEAKCVYVLGCCDRRRSLNNASNYKSIAEGDRESTCLLTLQTEETYYIVRLSCKKQRD